MPEKTRYSMLLTRCIIAGLLAFVPALFAQEGTGSVEGHVVNAVTGAPVRNANVALSLSYSVSQTAQNRTYEAQTDEQGRFAFHGLSAGGYRLTASRSGYIQTVYETRPASTEQLWIGDGQQLTGLVLRVRPHGVIAGKVLDNYDDPVQGANVIVIQRSSSNGRSQFMTAGSGATNDLGEYRIAGLAPGEYFVMAMPPRGTQRSGWDDLLPQQLEPVLIRTFYPAGTELESAKAVTVGLGAVVSGIDVKLGKALAARIRGTLIENSAPARRVGPVALRRSNATPGVDQEIYATMYGSSAFQFSGVPPGSYVLMAQRSEGQTTLAAARMIEVRDRNLEGITLEFTPAPDIQGTVVGDVARCRNVNVSLWGGTMSGRQPQGATGADQKFTLRGVIPGAYTLNVSTGGCYLQSVRFNGRDVANMALNVEGPGALELSLAYSGTVVDGTVTDSAGKPVISGSVVFRPKGGLISNPPIAQVRAGSFRAAGLPPGAYDVFAWDVVTYQSANLREYLQQYESSARSIVVEPGGRATLQLIAISAGAGGGAAGAGQARPAAKGSIEGQVLNAITGAPLAGARVMFNGQPFASARTGIRAVDAAISGGQAVEGSVEADPQGRFSLREIEPGIIYLAAEFRGFASPDQTDAGGERIVVGEGQRVSGAVLRMLPELVLSGKITDEYGEAVDRAQVTLYRASYSRGVRQLARIASTETDDLGQYRIPNVTPGSYYASASRRSFVRSVGGQLPRAGEPGMGYGTTWFPNASDVTGASAVVVEAAQPPYLTMVLRRAKVFRVRGTLLDAAGRPAPRAALSLTPRGLESSSSAGDMTMMANGGFEITNVPAGSYVLLARSVTRPVDAALLPVEVRDANVDGIKLQLSAGREIRGILKSDSGASVMTVRLYAQGLGGPSPSLATGSNFSLQNVLPAIYSVNIGGLCVTCYLKSVRYGGREFSQDAVDFSGDGQLEIEVSTRGASLQGTAVDRQGKPVPRASIVLAPAAGAGAIRIGVTDQAGRFDFASLRPGAYRIFAWTGIMPDPSPEALARFQGQAKSVTLPENGRERVEVVAQ